MNSFSTKEALLAALQAAPEIWQSGAALATRLGVSRTAVWKAAEELRADGFALESVPRRGYRLGSDTAPLTAESLRVLLGCDWQVEVWPSLRSTNDRARALAAGGAQGPALVASLEQTQGRGRRGRAFYSPAGSGLYFSLLLRPSVTTEDALLITAAAATAARRALSRFGVKTEIKWVNDLYRNGRKVCGVLTEAVLDLESGGLESLVAGFGLNLTAPQGGFPAELQEIAGPVFDRQPHPDAARIAAAIAEDFVALVSALPNTDFLSEYRAANLFVPGTPVTVLPPRGAPYPAVVEEIDNRARLVLRTGCGDRQLLGSGEARLRRSGEEFPAG